MEKDLKDMFELILNKLDGINSRLDGIDTRMDRFELRMDEVELRMDRFVLRMDRFELSMDRFESRMDKVESRQDEIYLVAKAIEHNNLVHGAEVDNIKFKVSSIEGTVNAVGNVFITRKAI